MCRALSAHMHVSQRVASKGSSWTAKDWHISSDACSRCLAPAAPTAPPSLRIAWQLWPQTSLQSLHVVGGLWPSLCTALRSHGLLVPFGVDTSPPGQRGTCSWLHVAVVLLAVVMAILRLIASPTPPLVHCHVPVGMRVPARCRRSWCFSPPTTPGVSHDLSAGRCLATVWYHCDITMATLGLSTQALDTLSLVLALPLSLQKRFCKVGCVLLYWLPSVTPR